MNPQPAPREVLLLCWRDSGHPQGGGSERYLERVGAELARRGVAVTYRTASYPGAPRSETVDGMFVSRGGGRLSVYPRALLAIAAGRLGRGPLAGRRFDAVIDTQNGIPFFATLVADAPTVLLVHHCHRAQWPVAGRLLGRIGWFLESTVSPRAHRRNRYLTVSDPSAADLRALGVEGERITVARNGIDPIPVLPGPLGLAGAPGLRLCVVSRLVPHKQIEDAITTLATLRRRGHDVHLHVVGDGWWRDRLRAMLTELDVVPHVTFHGHVDEVRKHQIIAGCDVHLMPSRTEGWGLAVIEAAQHGVPTIGYHASRGLTDSIVDRVTGLLAHDNDDMTRSAEQLLLDAEHRRELGRAAQRRAARYSWAATTDVVLDVVNQVCARPVSDCSAAPAQPVAP
ncbi:glycosyltransferase family 4 protein [Williamsia sp. CHRR-6]|uniref:glycosyltransferase family 4 protein n=1 Tax=Williamsia sp. CHRR-6 TaxID=2835871 RepID=UPI001BDAF7DE|nr:glycosyltransferase family 4 protein [Williamsia sp. CHRR-6]MBT0567479.1 glycosyltransferase family 4 protein [Williamsia sp. CHRR-6]